jgi:hypothetical protein
MSNFDFVNHESYPEDQYVAESVTLCFDGKYRVTYVRKKLQNGGMFWGEISVSVKQHGEKKFLKSFSQDSNFLQEDIRAFLDGRQWEKRGYLPARGGTNASSNDEVPF